MPPTHATTTASGRARDREHRSAHKRRRRLVILSAVLLTCVSPIVPVSYCRRHRFRADDLNMRRPSRLFRDRRGTIVRAELGDDDCWRLPVRVTDVSMHLVQASIAVEDRRFWIHRGVDWIAVCRAFTGNIANGRIVSGASTISMQLARLARPEPRGYPAKLRQALRALDLERKHDKDWIIEQYLNFAPYGGNLVGVEAAARAYFGKSAADLSLCEATLLAGLPQRPTAFRLDRSPQAARMRQRRVLESLQRIGYMDARQAESVMARTFPTVECPRTDPNTRLSRLGYPMSEAHFCGLASREGSSNDVRMTLDPSLQLLAREALRSQLNSLAGVADGAAVIIENASGAVRALVGTIDFAAQPHGEVNAACVRRSPGSALKPFIYLLAIDGGLIVPDTILDDIPLRYRDYRPTNFDRKFRHRISAREALTRSLNTPAVRLLAKVGPRLLVERLHSCGVRTLDRGAETYGLSLALGGGEVTLLELTNAYAGLARNGLFYPCRFTASPVERDQAGTVQRDAVRSDATRPFGRGAVALTVEMLATYPLPGLAGQPVAWKTGTSNGYRDAWCIAFDGELTVGVWLGNKSGRPARALVGAQAAAPVVAHIIRGACRDGRTRPLRVDPGHLSEMVLCDQSGLRARPTCPRTCIGAVPAGVPLVPCPLHQVRVMSSAVLRERDDETAAAGSGLTPPSPQILSPAPGVYLTSGSATRLEVRSATPGGYTWFIDGEHIGSKGEAFWHNFGRGKHRIACVGPLSGHAAQVEFQVR